MSPVPDEPADDAGASAKPAVVLTLPPITLSELKSPTKAYLLRRAGAGRGPWETMKELLDRGAKRQREGPVAEREGPVAGGQGSGC